MKLDSNNLQGKAYWRSLDQLADTPEFQEFLHREFPENASEMTNPVTRRKFLTLMGASIAFAGLAGCRKPVEKIVPYVKAPENIVLGNPLNYATAMPFGLNSYGLLVESHEGRPTKIEGNEKHPVSQGKGNRFTQAEILNLYDPDRSNAVYKQGKRASWEDFKAAWEVLYKEFASSGGEGLAVLSQSFNSPTLYRLYKEFKKVFPKSTWTAYEPVSDENVYEGLRSLSGKALQPLYSFDKAKVILALDSDFMMSETNDIPAARGFAKGRAVKDTKDDMNRLYVVEHNYTVTGAMADHRLRLQWRQIPAFVKALAGELVKQGLDVPGVTDGGSSSFDAKWLSAVARDLRKNKTKSLVVAGHRQPAEVHALCALINRALGNEGSTVTYASVDEAVLPSSGGLMQLAGQMQSGKVKALIMLGGNPVYDAPADADFSASMQKVETTVHLSSRVDETSAQVFWHIPAAHFLESWGDVRALDGTPSIVQPLIQPLFNGVEEVRMFHLLATNADKKPYDVVRETWQKQLSGKDFEKAWRKALVDGVIPTRVRRSAKVSFKNGQINLSAAPFNAQPATAGNPEVVFQASAGMFDGRYANNGWLQELPDPITKLAWDNPVLVSPRTAKELGVSNEDVVSLRLNGREQELPVWIVPGHADNSLTLTLGYGRTRAGRVGNKVGFNVYSLRSSKTFYGAEGASLTRTGKTYTLANTQDHGSMEGRPIVREADLAEYVQNPDFAKEMVVHPPLESLWDEYPYDKGYQWGMTIDLNTCIGCNACMIACQSENNIPVVGKELVHQGREMSWIRLDRYFSGNLEDPEVVYQPVACQQCENAPCEQVCPVAATNHDEEGLNVMVYNRCIGTRYCSNNCPYKVRRFNYFNFTKDYPETIKMAQNPDVTVRSRGVMEKCTYCTQRIERAKISSKNEGRELRDGEVVTACQQTCPTDAIVFGNILDPESQVSKIKAQNRNYELLAELNVKPRTSYLAKLRNPNPELENYNA